MVCGQEWCQLIDLLVENSYVAKPLGDAIKQLLLSLPGVTGSAIEWIGRHFEKLTAAAGFSFGLWKWWTYRESILHKRLHEYVSRSRPHLTQAHNDVVNAIVRPNTGGSPTAPLYAVASLRGILKRRNWEPVLNFTGTEHGADRKLRVAEQQVKDRIKIASDAMELLHQQTAHIFSVRGAIAATRAPRQLTAAKRNRLDLEALELFQQVQRIPGHRADLWAKECEAHQLRRLGQFDEALVAYLELEALAPNFDSATEDRLIVARSKRYRAEIHQALAIFRALGDDPAASAGSLIAWNLMTTKNPNLPQYPGALEIREPIDSAFKDWDLVEQAEMHFLSAFIAHCLSYGPSETRQLDDAAFAYNRVLMHTPSLALFAGPASRKLRQHAREGLKRIRRARTGGANCYDPTLFLPLEPLQQQAKSKSQTGSDDAVEEAADQRRVDDVEET